MEKRCSSNKLAALPMAACTEVSVCVCVREHQSLGVDTALLFTACTAHTRAGSP
jgi:hypothetical protein